MEHGYGASYGSKFAPTFTLPKLCVMKRLIILLPLLALMFSACVPGRVYDELKAKNADCETERTNLKKSVADLTAETKDKANTITTLNGQVNQLVRDSTIQGNAMRKLNNNYENLNKTYDLLLAKNKELLEGSERDTRNLTNQLNTTQKELLDKEDKLKALERDLNTKKDNLDRAEADLKKATADLAEKEKKVNELQSILDKKDSTVNALRTSVANALTGFNNNGLTVNIRNGKVYVSMDESLLFASGSSKIDSKGADAIKRLAKVLETNTDVNVMVEGHTDDVPLRGAGEIKDNWDLSVMRATSVVKLLVNSATIDPTRITAAGHGEYLPLDPAKTPEARKKNRRTEIILTPKLDELFKVIESN